MDHQQSNKCCFLFISLRTKLEKTDDFRTVKNSYVKILFLDYSYSCIECKEIKSFSFTVRCNV